MAAQSPAPLSDAEAAAVRAVVARIYGDAAVVRNYGPDPNRLCLHVEADMDPGLERSECLGHLTCDVIRDHIHLEVTRRGRPIRGAAKVAYRQGVIL
jgi:hypothetical protein